MSRLLQVRPGEFTVARYLVETYVPGTREQNARAAGRLVRDAVRELSSNGTPVRYVRTTLLPADETCFHVLEAPSREAVVAACRLAGLERARIVDAVE